ncbi:recombinase family protein [Methylorubrum populi]
MGYARVSTHDQSPALQLDAFAAAKCERVFTEKASGDARDRPQLKAALAFMRVGDNVGNQQIGALPLVEPACARLRAAAPAMDSAHQPDLDADGIVQMRPGLIRREGDEAA